ncbi:putative lipoprotein [Leptospira fainei serovar Hurstbridge str. BUT 6]|uniref:Lipoprotein n=1 Tax=Leptospira fainei serovar Hurstbridge str. BUT 6 TaxID=1193011 RepID=S3UVS8_9LEPT|nr:putative lipoprotein [Leptospira fainei serovar Hurstbridge str. BUT 6]
MNFRIFPIRIVFGSAFLLLNLVFGSCSLLPEWIRGDHPLVEDSRTTRVYWNLSQVPKTSEAYQSQPSNLRYIVVNTEPSKERVWKGEVDLWETKEEFQNSLPKGIVFPKFSFKAAILSGVSKLEEGELTNPKKISFVPKIDEVWDWEGDSFPQSALSILSKRFPVEDWFMVFDLRSDEAWLSKESRNLGNGSEIVWQNLRTRGSLLTTDLIHPSGKSFPYADYDYRQVGFITLPVSAGALPIWIFKREKGAIWAWGLLPEDLVSSQILLKQRNSKGSPFASFLFYDASSNIPFTTRADLRNYPIIILSDQNNVRQ